MWGLNFRLGPYLTFRRTYIRGRVFGGNLDLLGRGIILGRLIYGTLLRIADLSLGKLWVTVEIFLKMWLDLSHYVTIMGRILIRFLYRFTAK